MITCVINNILDGLKSVLLVSIYQSKIHIIFTNNGRHSNDFNYHNKQIALLCIFDEIVL